MNQNLNIKAYHIEGELNVGLDVLSRGRANDFLNLFPHMQPEPTPIPANLQPECFDVSNW